MKKISRKSKYCPTNIVCYVDLLLLWEDFQDIPKNYVTLITFREYLIIYLLKDPEKSDEY
jgi:hypothetical protein